MEIERLIRQTAVGGFIVAGGVVLSQTGASASEAPAPLKKRVIEASTAPSQPAAAAATPSRAAKAAPKGAATPKRKAAPARRQPAAKPATTKAATTKPAASAPVAAKPSPAAPGRASTAVAAGPDLVPAVPAPVAAGAGTATLTVAPLEAPDAPVASPASTPTAALDDPIAVNPAVPSRTGHGPAAEPTLVGLPLAADSTTAPESGLGQTVAAGDPPADLQGQASAAANPALVSSGGQAQSAALTGTSPSGQVTVTIDQPRPGTVVGPGRPVLVTGTVTVGGGGSGPINVIYVLDVSGSTSGSGGACGDPNGDGDPDTILDCEVAALTALNGSLSSSTANVNVSLVTFSTGASTVDLSPAPGLQATTRPATDASGNGVPDVIDILRSQSPGGGTEFDAALAQVRGLLVAGAQNLVFFLSDGQSSLSTGPGSDLQAIAGAGARVLTYAVGTGTSGCAAGQPLAAIATATGGTCTEVTDPSRLGVVITSAGIGGIGQVHIEVNGHFLVEATLDGTGGFSALVPADLLRPGRNDIFAIASDGGSQIAIADTFVLVGNRLVSGGDLDDFDLVGDDDDEGFLLADLDDDERRVEALSFGEVTGLLPATGSGPGHLAATGALSFLLGGLFVGGGRHLRRRRVGAPA